MTPEEKYQHLKALQYYAYLRERVRITEEYIAKSARQPSRLKMYRLALRRLRKRIKDLREKHSLREYKERDTLKQAKIVLAERIRQRKEGLL
jgi:hypothetical protein